MFIICIQESSHKASDRGWRGMLHVPAEHVKHEEAGRMHRGAR